MRTSSTPVWNTKCATSLMPTLAATIFSTTNHSSRRSLLTVCDTSVVRACGVAVCGMDPCVLLSQPASADSPFSGDLPHRKRAILDFVRLIATSESCAQHIAAGHARPGPIADYATLLKV